jgi:hypothetical protein
LSPTFLNVFSSPFSAGVIKRFLEGLKYGNFTEESLKLFVPCFKALVTSTLAPDSLRFVALFITYAIHKPTESKAVQKKKSMRLDWRPRRTTGPQPPDASGDFLSKERIGVEILRAYADIFCSPDDTVNIKKFARTVTNKVRLSGV